jgi:NADH-quinone oxidoreductase E subunit
MADTYTASVPLEKIEGPIVFTAEELALVEMYKSRYPEQKAALMRTLWLAQKKWGWLSQEVQEYVADLLGLSSAHVKGVASFYTMYYKKPMGKYHIQVCTNISCMLCGGEELYAHFKERLGIGHNQVTADKKFSLEEVECMGACGYAPMMAINEDYHENVTIESADVLVNGLS